MILILLTSFFVSLGSYLIRKGSIVDLLLSLINKASLHPGEFWYTILGIILNIIGIILWQIGSKSNIPFSVAWPIYLSTLLLFGSIISFYLDKIKLEGNFYIGFSFILIGVLILTRIKT